MNPQEITDQREQWLQKTVNRFYDKHEQIFMQKMDLIEELYQGPEINFFCYHELNEPELNRVINTFYISQYGRNKDGLILKGPSMPTITKAVAAWNEFTGKFPIEFTIKPDKIKANL